MLYNDIVIDGMIKRAAYQAAQETVYMMKRAAFDGDMGTPDLTGGERPINVSDRDLQQVAIMKRLLGKTGTRGLSENDLRVMAVQAREAAERAKSEGVLPPPDDRGSAPAPDWDDPNNAPTDYSGVGNEIQQGLFNDSLNQTQEDINNQILGTGGGKGEDESAWSKILDHLANNKFTYGGGAAGAGIGALLGDTPKDRLLYALLGGGGGAGLGALADHYLK